MFLLSVAPAPARAEGADAQGAPAAAKAELRLQWRPVPRVSGRISASELGVVINSDDPYSVAVGEYYVHKRQIAPSRVLRVRLPRQARLSVAELEALRAEVDGFFGDRVQALALAWVQPYAVQCQSITAALSLGLDPDACAQTCAASRRPSPYFNSASARPWTDHGIRPSMLLAASGVAQAHALIDRGLASDHSLLRGAPMTHAHFVITRDAQRSVRARLFPPPGVLRRMPVQTHIDQTDHPRDLDRVLLMQTGLAVLGPLDSIRWVPGALADHLTSFGGVLEGGTGQSSILTWIDAGVTASYGTVSEPCNHLQKFPHPQILLLHYMQGGSALEAYWKSVAWPAQGVFVGDPLAAPFATYAP
ncbi:uncharacterized protein (TIGR03790 family) [Sphaerotilus hippei]|uniref:Uncharacterized protein (TIGR03790 family) n=1 Tax=Sphaerotilus hippei TaxID=744406 RepID=A0A318H480_9BURK|nr:TIGR03790 family protein [Sphaerotilus hippei]PXW98612.1 uncharacterized protein (TIGR03790 family) [Sphaerotilus hippei]